MIDPLRKVFVPRFHGRRDALYLPSRLLPTYTFWRRVRNLLLLALLVGSAVLLIRE